jgi:PAS domain-containing protein
MSQSLRILLIADDPDVIRRIGQGLQRQDSGLILIEGADSLQTARRRLGSGSYDLALVELGLDQGDGLHLLSDLREIAPELPIVALAADSAAPDIAACLALGAHDRLTPDAMDSAGLVDRLLSAAARARADRDSRRRSQRIAGSLEATGDLAWHFESGDDEVWLAAAEPAAWQLPAPDCRESLDALPARIHPDDREIALRRIEELAETSQPWQLEARIRVGGGAYRWCILRGRSQLDEHGRLARASGVLSDGQRQQKVLREVEQGRRFLRAIFDSERVPHAILDSSGVIADCNQAWLALKDPACHAGREFKLGREFSSPSAETGKFGDLDLAGLARGIRQVLGGVAEQFNCEYGDGRRRWRISVAPLLNPGIAGAMVGHEEITASRRGQLELQAGIAALENDFRAISGPVLRVDTDLKVVAANEAAQALGRAPFVGRDVLKALPRLHADVVGDMLAAISAGGSSAVRDSRPVNGKIIRWVVNSRRDALGNAEGFLVQGVDVSDLAAKIEQVPVKQARDDKPAKLLKELEQERRHLASARRALVAAAEESEQMGARLTELERRVSDEQRRIAELNSALAAAEAARAELRAGEQEARGQADAACRRADEAFREADKLRRQAEEARRQKSELERAGNELAETLAAERARHGELVAALSAAEQVPIALKAQLARARSGLREELHELVDKLFSPLLSEPETVADSCIREDETREAH